MVCLQKRLRHKRPRDGFVVSKLQARRGGSYPQMGISCEIRCHNAPLSCRARTPVMLCAPPCHAARTSLSCRAHTPVMPGAHPCHAGRTTLSCCAQSQHPERPVERSEPEVAGFRDYARNDEVEDATLYGEYRDVMRRARPVMPCAHPCHAARSRSIQKGLQNALSPGLLDSATNARNDEVEDPTLCGDHRDITLRVHPCHACSSFAAMGAARRAPERRRPRPPYRPACAIEPYRPRVFLAFAGRPSQSLEP